MIAAFIGNFVYEGNFGKFESSKYVRKPEKKPKNLQHMDDVHDYRTYLSGKNIVDVGIGMLKQFRKEGNCSDDLHKFGFGMAQWTGERCERLIDRYLEKIADNDLQLTREICAEIEVDYLLEELNTSMSNVVEKCESETVGMSGTEKVERIAEIVLQDFEKPKKEDFENKKKKRQEAACIWYNILTGENDEK